jgi:hypothetical protein
MTFDAGLQELGRRRQLDEFRCRAMDRPALVLADRAFSSMGAPSTSMMRPSVCGSVGKTERARSRSGPKAHRPGFEDHPDLAGTLVQIRSSSIL